MTLFSVMINKWLLSEGNITDGIVREVVKNIVSLIKKGQEGRSYLPEDVSDGEQFEYTFKNVPEFSVELLFSFESNIENEYQLDARTVDDGFVIEIILKVNPKFYPQSMYDIIGDLNEIVAHEIEHLYQESGKRPHSELDTHQGGIETRPTGKEYYLQPHEVPAQLKGFKRLKDIKKDPIEKTIRDWFYRNRSVNNLNDQDIEELTNFLVQKYSERYS